MKSFDSSQFALPDSEPQNLELQSALKAHRDSPSPQTRKTLLNELKNCFVWVAVQQLPEHLRAVGIFVLQEDTPLVMLSSTNERGETRRLIFSDRAQVLARKPDAESIAMPAVQAAQSALDDGLEGLVIDPAGHWAELTRAETETLAREIAL